MGCGRQAGQDRHLRVALAVPGETPPPQGMSAVPTPDQFFPGWRSAGRGSAGDSGTVVRPYAVTGGQQHGAGRRRGIRRDRRACANAGGAREATTRSAARRKHAESSPSCAAAGTVADIPRGTGLPSAWSCPPQWTGSCPVCGHRDQGQGRRALRPGNDVLRRYSMACAPLWIRQRRGGN